MKKLLFLLGAAALLLSSCSPRIYGATPHRRDRHCGCENINKVQPSDSLMADYPQHQVR